MKNEADASSMYIAVWKHFFSNSYCRRLWIVQEIMLARYIRIICRETLLLWDELRRFYSSGINTLPAEAMQSIPPQVIWLTEHALSAKRYSFPTPLRTFCTNECDDAGDKFDGLQDLLENDARVLIDHEKSMEEVFLLAAGVMVTGTDGMLSNELIKLVETFGDETPTERDITSHNSCDDQRGV